MYLIMENTLNQRVVELRSVLNLSQADFAAKLGLTQVAIWRIESGETQPRRSTLEKICTTFNVDRNWFINGVGELRFSEGKNSTSIAENPWKDALVQQLNDEIKFLRNALKLALGSKEANFLNGNVFSGVFAGAETGVSVRA